MTRMTDEEIQQKINEILADQRLSYKTALIQINAPLALIQISMESQLHTYQRGLGVPLTKIRELRGEQNNA